MRAWMYLRTFSKPGEAMALVGLDKQKDCPRHDVDRGQASATLGR
jgi:hypothetical protein